jgi:Mor family transcriptional regulator
MEEIKSDYESGMNLTQLAKKYGVARETIRTRLKEMGA